MSGDGSNMIAGAGTPVPAPAMCGRTEPPVLALTLWPNRSLSIRGARIVIVLVAAGLSVPLIPLMGTSAAWGLLPFLAGALVALYAALRRSYVDGRLTERVCLWPDLITVERREPRGAVRRWQADPYWVQLSLRDNAPIENYLTLRGSGREIELGAFLSPEERVALYRDLARALRRLRSAPTPA